MRWSELTPREKDVECAKLPIYFTDQDFTHGTGWHVWNKQTSGYDVLAYYTTDDGTARELEDEIERRGDAIQDEYVRRLLSIAIPDGSCVGTFWKLIRAKPDQRAQAFVQTMKGAHDATMG